MPALRRAPDGAPARAASRATPGTPALPATIDEVVDALGAIVARARREDDRAGLFAALYRRTTIAVREAIHAGRFDDPDRMEHLDVVFAERYFRAYDAHRRGDAPTGPWAYAFARAAEPGHLALQHLLLGVNAHIAFDLGVAACATCPGDALDGLERDFFVINDILAARVDRVQGDLNRVSPRLAELDRLGGWADERLASAFLAHARRGAWGKARRYAATEPGGHPGLLTRWDAQVTRVAARICPPARRVPAPTRALLAWVGAGETRDLNALLDVVDVA